MLALHLKSSPSKPSEEMIWLGQSRTSHVSCAGDAGESMPNELHGTHSHLIKRVIHATSPHNGTEDPVVVAVLSKHPLSIKRRIFGPKTQTACRWLSGPSTTTSLCTQRTLATDSEDDNRSEPPAKRARVGADVAGCRGRKEMGPPRSSNTESMHTVSRHLDDPPPTREKSKRQTKRPSKYLQHTPPSENPPRSEKGPLHPKRYV
ncbi:hypothetical protein M758_UG101400 [Ceratodon purpureus]|nr:hypothetical protein M758_UG101400 [Ceratodon purpureus]